MAAPGNVYVGSLPGVRTTGEQEVLITTSAESTSLLKDRFYLDYFICLDSTAGVGMQGKWAGACIVGSPNYYMHNIVRHGWLEFYLNNEKYVVFWDAGLNTLGKSFTPFIVNPVFNEFTVAARFKSAYHLDGTAKLEWRRWNEQANSWGAWNVFGYDTQWQSVDGNKSWSTDLGNITQGDRINGISFRSSIQNDEGIYTDPQIVYLFASGVPITFINPNITLYMNTSELVPAPSQGYATVLYQDASLVTPHPVDGVNLYLIDTPTYKRYVVYGYSVQLGYDCVLSITDWRPEPSPPSPFSYRGYNVSDQNAAEMQAINNSSGDLGTIYLNVDAGTAHKTFTGTAPDWVFGEKANQGYYVEMRGPWPNPNIQRVVYVNASGEYDFKDIINT